MHIPNLLAGMKTALYLQWITCPPQSQAIILCALKQIRDVSIHKYF
jgi:hypothetical protein